MIFHKYHALGNDYIVLDPNTFTMDLKPDRIRNICDRHFGLGADGILFGPLQPSSPSFSKVKELAFNEKDEKPLCGVRIFNPDGSEAEKSGNGVRIFCRYLYDINRISADEPFQLVTLGGEVGCRVSQNANEVAVEMGHVSFNADDIPVSEGKGEILNDTITAGNYTYTYSAATIGNPHCIILKDELSVEEMKESGPLLENHTQFPNRTNVQFMQVLDRHNLQIEIWERGAGYTLASGSSASACAATARKLGLCDCYVAVHMPGGNLDIEISDDYHINLKGPVTAVASGTLSSEMTG